MSGMSKGKFVLNRSGVLEMLRSEEMRSVVEQYASKIASSAGSGYSYDARIAGRAVARAFADSNEARRECEEQNTLLKAAG